MAATLGCASTHINAAAPVVAISRGGAAGSPSVVRFPSSSGGFSRAVVRMMASNSDNVREVASEKAVESGKAVAEDTTKLAGGESVGALDAAADDSSDAASYSGDARASVLDVASDMAVDPADVDAQATKDAEPLAQESGRSVDETVQILEDKAEEVSEREVRREN